MPSLDLVADFGPYQLVVRPSGAEYVAVLWRTGGPGAAQRLITATGITLDGARAALERSFYEERLEEAGAKSSTEYARAFSYLWPKLTEAQRKMLQAQYRADRCTLTTIEMAEIVGWKSHSPVNLWYGLAGFALFGEVPREIAERNTDGAPIYSFALSTGERVEREKRAIWAWSLRQQVADGLAAAGLRVTA